MKVTASLNNVRIAPRKVRLVARSIVGMPVAAALTLLSKQVKRSSNPMKTLLSSAIANAENNFKLDRNNLIVSEAIVGEGVRLKRWMPKAFGRATPIYKRMSKVRIVLSDGVSTEAKESK